MGTMATRDPRIDAYIAAAAPFARPILERLREHVHRACPTVEETLKWGAPSFGYRGKILCGMAAFKQHAAFGFHQHAQVLGDAAPREGMGSFGKMTRVADVPGVRTLTPLLRKAMALIDAGVPARGGRKTQAAKPAPVAPPDLVAALKKNAAARRTFEGFAPSHLREYVDWLAEAKRDETRARRLAQAIAWLAEGKPRHWKYQTG
jgi:uncharacterized protein YdeI (YjbR/CyaY-like superfamily)